MRAVMALAAAHAGAASRRGDRAKARPTAVVREPAVIESYLGAEAVG